MRNKIKNIDTSIHFIGCGGIGMCGLALLSLQAGYNVSGSDLIISKNTDILLKSGVAVSIGHSIANLPRESTYIVVYSSAIQTENPELCKAQEQGIKCYKRGEYLALIAQRYKRVVSIAGSHGKTTVTAMLVHILKQCKCQNIGYLIGGWPVGLKTLGKVGNSDIFVIEVDESDLSLTLMSSHIGVVLNLDDDHSWNIGGKEKLKRGFVRFAERSNLLIYPDNKEFNNIFKHNSINKKIIDLENENINKTGWNQIGEIWGKYQRNNATVAVAVAVELGILQTEAIEAVKTFSGVERRMQKIFSNENVTILEDYAHHPVEVNAAISAVRETSPNQQLTVIFQPHRHARLKHYFNEFTFELKKADRIFTVPVFSAWSSTDIISSKDLANNIGEKAVSLDGTWKEIAGKVIKETILEKSIILTLGAGNINKVIPYLISACTKSISGNV